MRGLFYGHGEGMCQSLWYHHAGPEYRGRFQRRAPMGVENHRDPLLHLE